MPGGFVLASHNSRHRRCARDVYALLNRPAVRSVFGLIQEIPMIAKIQPFLAELRALTREHDFCRHLEAVVLAAPDAEETLARRRDAIRAAFKARQANR